ncbi:hypothetical protein JCM3775_006559 [Rhodotorula graminis]
MASRDWRMPSTDLIGRIAAASSFILVGAHHYALSRISRHATTRLLGLALVPVALRAVAAAVWVHLSSPSAGSPFANTGSRSTRSWAIAACEVVRTFSQVAASRLNPVWVWASTDLFIPLLFLVLPATPATDPPRATRLYAAVAVASFASAWTWRSDLNAEGLFLALVSVGAETMRQWLARQEVDEASGRVDEAVEAVRDSSLRAIVLHIVAYVALYPLDLHEPYAAYSQATLAGYLVAWPILALLASTASALALHLNALDFSTATAVYSAANALILALVAWIGWQNADTAAFRVVLFILFAAGAASQLVPTTLGGVSLDLEPGHGAAYDPLASSPSSKVPSSRSRAPSPRLLAVLPASLSLLCASCLGLAPSPTLDIVVAHHSLPPSTLAHHVAAVREAPLARLSRVRVYLYEKGNWSDEALWGGLSGALRRGRDEVVRLPNVGREGGTYLEHIVAHYNASTPSSSSPRSSGAASWVPGLGRLGLGGARPLADTTLFLQEHLAWDWVGAPRLRRTLSTRTAFVSLGPYQTNLCGLDSEVRTQMGGIRDIFEMVKGRPCTEGNEEDRVLSTWAGQFAASRRTLLKNELKVYERLVRMIEAPDDDPIHKQYNPSGPSTASNPAFGHALERSWPLLLHCDDKRIAETCPDRAFEPKDCQCFEET